MATLTVSPGDYLRPHLGHVRLDHYPEATTQTFKKGAPLLHSVVSGKENQVKVSTTDAVLGFVGVAADDASGVEGTDITIWVAEPGVEFIGRVQDTGVLSNVQLGVAYGLVFDATNAIWRVDLSDTTNVSVIVTHLVDAVGDVNGRVAFQFKASARSPYLG
jgi:hypothetical protein